MSDFADLIIYDRLDCEYGGLFSQGSPSSTLSRYRFLENSATANRVSEFVDPETALSGEIIDDLLECVD